MDVGVFLGTQHMPDADIRKEFENHVEQTKVIRDSGFDALWLAQHYLTYPDQFLQTNPMMARLAADAGDMRLGTNILVLPLHNIIDIAEQYATIDIITGGRLILGAALGYRDIEYDNFGVDRKRRAKLFDEQIDALKLLWEEDNATYQGEFVKFENISIRPRPLQRPRPPIWIGAAADPAVKRAARKGDAWIATSVTAFEPIKEQVGIYHKERELAGLPANPDGIVSGVELYCAPTKAEAMELGATYIANKYKAYYAWGMGKNVPGESGADLPLEELIKGRFIVGTPDDCIEECRRRRDELGCSHLQVRMNFPGMPLENVLKGIRLFGKEVLPHIR